MSESAAPPPPAPRRRTWITVVLCLLIFGGGLAVGAGGTVLWVVRHMRDAVQHPEAAPHRVADRLRRRLGLDDTQTAGVEAAIERHQPELLDARADFLERVDPVFEAIDADVASVLPADKIDEWHRQFRCFRDDWVPRPEHFRHHSLR